MVGSNFAFIDPVSTVYYGGSGWLRAYQNDYVIDNYGLFVFVALRPMSTAMVIAGRIAQLDNYGEHAVI